MQSTKTETSVAQQINSWSLNQWVSRSNLVLPPFPKKSPALGQAL